MVEIVYPANQYTFVCRGQSFMKAAGEILSLVENLKTREVELVCFNHADNTISTLHNTGVKMRLYY